jgi:hypothetical protein
MLERPGMQRLGENCHQRKQQGQMPRVKEYKDQQQGSSYYDLEGFFLQAFVHPSLP